MNAGPVCVGLTRGKCGRRRYGAHRCCTDGNLVLNGIFTIIFDAGQSPRGQTAENAQAPSGPCTHGFIMRLATKFPRLAVKGVKCWPRLSDTKLCFFTHYLAEFVLLSRSAAHLQSEAPNDIRESLMRTGSRRQPACYDQSARAIDHPVPLQLPQL